MSRFPRLAGIPSPSMNDFIGASPKSYYQILTKFDRFLKKNVQLSSLGDFEEYYANVLSNNQAIFYFPSPYHDWRFSILNIAAYIPFLMLILIVPLIVQNIKVFKTTTWTTFSKYLFTLNSLTYLALIFMFAYWKLYNVF